MSKSREIVGIVVVGAGASGIAAATRLLEKGFKNVQILEAETRLGGRIHTIPFADNVVDLGAQWCHGENGNAVYEMVKDLCLLERTGDLFGTVRCVRSNKEEVPQELAITLRGIAAISVPDGPSPYAGSVGEYMSQKYWQQVDIQLPSVDRALAEEMLESCKRSESSLEGSDNLLEVSGRGHLEFAESDGDQLLNWRDLGFERFLRLLMSASDQPDDLSVLKGRVHYQKRVTEINSNCPCNLKVRCSDGGTLNADHVICTVSLGVLQEQHETLFVPALPAAKVNAIKSLKLGTVDKFYLEFSAPPLPNDCAGFYCLWMEQDLQVLRSSEFFWLESITGCHRVSYQPRLLQAWIAGEHARHMETLPEEKVLEGLNWLFRKFLNFDVPQAKRFVRTQWHSNPNFRGSYSFRTTKADELSTGPWDLETPVMNDNGHPILLFAGEASSKTHYSTVHGAVEAGWREANRLNDFYQDISTK
ncbi:spermine oxidase-like [Drosophila guanche]|uniref:Blast:Spermine oxidase n=1 Tax=Drosophila guanche TaxID=7266 RepID=A0A3B0JN90_DROGU|nr:spermine oxidase-like [Drosophila guanche]SPP76970.1 blast:Spermine oxidase [Drosophila guanche]